MTDEIEIHNEKDRSENKQRVYDKVVDSNVVPTNPSQDQDVVDISHLDDLPTVDTINDMVDKVEQSQMSQWLQSTFHRSKRIASKYFARS